MQEDIEAGLKMDENLFRRQRLTVAATAAVAIPATACAVWWTLRRQRRRCCAWSMVTLWMLSTTLVDASGVCLGIDTPETKKAPRSVSRQATEFATATLMNRRVAGLETPVGCTRPLAADLSAPVKLNGWMLRSAKRSWMTVLDPMTRALLPRLIRCGGSRRCFSVRTIDC